VFVGKWKAVGRLLVKVGRYCSGTYVLGIGGCLADFAPRERVSCEAERFMGVTTVTGT